MVWRSPLREPQFRRFLFLLFTMAVLIVVYFARQVPTPSNSVSPTEFTFSEMPSPVPAHPEAVLNHYKIADDVRHPYYVQEPEEIAADAPVLIYVHGAGGAAGQGMGEEFAKGCFIELRNVMAERGWIYISPSDYEWKGLLKDIRVRYGERPLYVAGNSMGGAETIREVLRNPDPYDGLILSCPAYGYSTPSQKAVNGLTMPIVIIAGEKDSAIARFSQIFANMLAKFNDDAVYVEIPGAGHGEPLTHCNWAACVDFVHSRVTAGVAP